MTERLPQPFGRRIDRTRPLTFEFEGESLSGYHGDTLASALMANGRWLLSRSFKYHRPRGPLTMSGADANTLVQLPQTPNVLADTLPLTEGLVAHGQNYRGSLQKDKDQLPKGLSRFLRAGFYYRSLFRPRGIWARWEPLIRRKAGLGKLDLTAPVPTARKTQLHCDLAVVGAGPAGLQAALTAAANGARVIVLEAEPEAGGALNYHAFAERDHALELRETLLAHIVEHTNIQLLLNTHCSGWFADHLLTAIHDDTLYHIRAKHTVFAAGVYEQPAVFANNDLPGIIMASAAERLITLYGVRPGQQAVVLTGNDEGYATAQTLLQAGVTVAAVVELRLTAPRFGQQLLKTHKVPLFTGHCVFEARAQHQHLTAVEVRAIVAEPAAGSLEPTVSDQGQWLDCDVLCMSTGFMPAWHLPCVAGGRLAWDQNSQRFAVQDLPEGVSLAGCIRGVTRLQDVLADGEFAAWQALTRLGHRPRNLVAPSPQLASDTVWPIFPHPNGHEFVDFDEDLHLQDLQDTVALGYSPMQLLKRYSTLGMGPSQGRHAALAAAQVVAALTGQSVTQTGVTTARAPVVAEPLPLLAAGIHHPQRHTPMHALHLQAGAQMVPAGNWLRPAWYGPSQQGPESIAREVQQVRKGAGLIDLSTLGKIELRGPDALTFLNRIYTGNFSSLKVGRVRYALACNLQGAVSDDGVVYRLSEQHYYLTATTTGVDKLYREMTRWNAQWRLQVDIYQATSAYAAVNLAGPLSRKILQPLVDLTSLAEADFPYMHGITARVAGIPARLLRVGFVGELGFEIHVSAGFGAQLWQALMAAGEAYALRPFGVEAQRLLRLEKGHIIVGQDTDALSHPEELAMGWAIGRNKPFFIGQRSLGLLQQKPAGRALLGFTVPTGSATLKEGQLVVLGDEVVGAVTSVAKSPTLGCVIGLALAPSGSETLHIKTEAGVIAARVTPTPFYDPDNLRQTPELADV